MHYSESEVSHVKEMSSSDQKGVCNYNLHLERTTNHLEKHGELVQELKICVYALLAIVVAVIVVVIIWLLVKVIKQTFNEKVAYAAERRMIGKSRRRSV